MIPSRVIYVLFQDGYSVRFLAKLFGERETMIQHLLREELKRRKGAR
jgi:hypothetical protein